MNDTTRFWCETFSENCNNITFCAHKIYNNYDKNGVVPDCEFVHIITERTNNK